MPKDQSLTAKVYDDQYIQECFVIWYAAGAPKEPSKILEIIPPDKDGIKPNKNQVKFLLRNNWGPHAEALNADSERDVEIQLIAQRKEILSRQANEGRILQEKGMAYLQSKEFKNAGEAIRAVILGAALESKSSGIDLLMNIMGKSDKELRQFIKEQQTKAKGDDMESLEGEFLEESDATSSDEGND